MQNIGKYFGRQIYWLNYDKFSDQLPDKDWVCLAVANQQPDLDKFDNFVRTAIAKDILEFKGHGKFGEKLHDLFDETMIVMETMEDHNEIGVMTTLCLADERGNDCRKLLEPGSKLIHEFYANCHFDAMTIYYKFMDWGTYTTEFEIDKQPYDNKNAL